MTDNKPLITYAGDVPVFHSVAPSLQKGIGAEAVEWKRAYGRSTKLVHLHPRFIPLSDPPPDVVQSGSNNEASSTLTSLLDQPMLHTFWTDCSDVEIYRTTTKDVIQSWLNSIKNANVKEWLIILVEPSDNKKANKLIPRSSVLDKIKNDFAQKQTERCICLSDPQKIDSKSAESLNAMLHRIRQLLLASYSKTLTRFEENMRAQREKRIEGGWNFCHYFLLQEELAFVLEMLEVYDEALVQYDELDALFTQFVLNSHFTDTPKWLLSFQRYGDRWPALNLSCVSGGSKILTRVRETIRNSTVSLLNFRNYLFARQASLLVKQRRVNELAQRSLAFLHICINELNILDVTFTEEGAISCWVFVSCMEILGTISSHDVQSGSAGPVTSAKNANNAQAHGKIEEINKKTKQISQAHLPHASILDFSVHTASLWDYAREKLYELGSLCGLLPKSQLRGDHLHKVITLAAGLNAFEDFSTSNGNGSGNHLNSVDGSLVVPPSEESPIEKLKDALSSKERFEKNYFEICELAMGTYKHIGRLRSARRVGLSLASYYMEAEEFSKSTAFLTDALHTFKDDKWTMLVMDVLLKLAHCYQAMNDVDRYIRTCAQIACSNVLSEERRVHYFNEMMNFLNQGTADRFIMSPSEGTFSISSLSIDTRGKINGTGCDIIVNIELSSNLPRPILSNLVQMAIIPCDHIPKQINYSTAGAFVQGEAVAKGKPGKGIAKRGSGENLRRKDSSEGGEKMGEIENLSGKERLARKESTTPMLTCEDEDLALALLEINLTSNRIDIRQSLESGSNSNKPQDAATGKEKCSSGKLSCHNPHQSLRRKDSSQVQGETHVTKTDFSEAAKTAEAIINPGVNKIELVAKVTKPGSYRLAQVAIIVRHFELLSPRLGCRYRFVVEKEPPTMQIIANNLVAGVDQVVTIQLNTGSYVLDEGMVLPVRSSMGMSLKQNSELSSNLCSEMLVPLPSTQPFGSARVAINVKADLVIQKDSTVIEHKLIAKCPWTNEDKRLSLTFVPPFISSYKLHSIGQRKFLQVLLIGNSDSNFTVCDHQLNVQSSNSQNVPLVSLNAKSQSLMLEAGKSAAYMWEVGVSEVDDDQPLRLEFSVKFKSEKSNWEVYKYYICLQRLQTQYELKAKVEPHNKGTEFCRVGNMSSMIIEISRFSKNSGKKNSDEPQQSSQNSLMYEVRADQHLWAICGRSSGIISLDDNGNGSEHQVSLDVMPMSPGYLPLPTVHLSKYIPADQKGGSSNVPKLEPFNAGQVYNGSKGEQVHVLPPPQSGTGSSTITLGGGAGSSLPIISDSHF